MKDKAIDRIYSNGLGLCRMDKNLSLYCVKWKSLSMTCHRVAYSAHNLQGKSIALEGNISQ